MCASVAEGDLSTNYRYEKPLSMPMLHPPVLYRHYRAVKVVPDGGEGEVASYIFKNKIEGIDKLLVVLPLFELFAGGRGKAYGSGGVYFVTVVVIFGKIFAGAFAGLVGNLMVVVLSK